MAVAERAIPMLQVLHGESLAAFEQWRLSATKVLLLTPMAQQFEGKVVVVTGAGSGIGRATAEEFGQTGSVRRARGSETGGC